MSAVRATVPVAAVASSAAFASAAQANEYQLFDYGRVAVRRCWPALYA